MVRGCLFPLHSGVHRTHTMRTLNSQELAQVSGAKTTIVVDVNQVAQYVNVNLVTDTKTYKLFSIDWSKWGLKAPAA